MTKPWNLFAWDVIRRSLDFQRLGVDRAVGYLLLTRLAQFLSYPIVMLLIARRFTTAEQGYYYTFFSVLALQVFVDLGLATVIVNAASHEWAFLRTDQSLVIGGHEHYISRLVSLGRVAFKWYAVAGLVFVSVIGPSGWIFFSRNSASAVNWQQPWIVLVGLAGLLLWVTPFNAVLEGCNQIARLNSVRLQQVILENLALCVGLLLKAGLWCAAISLGVRLARNAYFLFFENRHFFAPFWRLPAGPKVDWLREIWPMQWRLAVSGLVAYFLTGLFNPVMFHYHGAVIAGQMGMTLQMVIGLQTASMAWVITKVPVLGALIAKKQYAELDRMWRRASVLSVAMLCAGSVLLGITFYCLKSSGVAFAQRVLDPLSTTLLIIAGLVGLVLQCHVFYLRAHKREPIMLPSIAGCLLSGLLVWLLGRAYGPMGAAAGYLVTMILVAVWVRVIWRRCRAQWHVA